MRILQQFKIGIIQRVKDDGFHFASALLLDHKRKESGTLFIGQSLIEIPLQATVAPGQRNNCPCFDFLAESLHFVRHFSQPALSPDNYFWSP